MTSLDDLELYDTVETAKVHACIVGFTLGVSIAVLVMVIRFVATFIKDEHEL
jgi:hypothetical protein